MGGRPGLSTSFTVLYVLACLTITRTNITPDFRSRTNITTDQYALLTLKAHITHDSRNFLAENWTSTASVCYWIGVTCDARHQRVTALDLSFMGLWGTIPPEIGKLSFLSSFTITNNSFHGSLPGELAHLPRLKIVDIANNNFSGEIPSLFNFLPKLERLVLHGNNFMGTLPTWLFNISTLKHVNLSHNLLHGNIPAPAEFGNIEEIDVSWNQISGSIPSTFWNMSLLRLISFGFNGLSGSLPDDLCQKLTLLQVLAVAGNGLFGPIPSNNLSQCRELNILSLWDNKFDGGIPRDIGKLTNLKGLYLGFNKLTGRIPTEIGNCTLLVEIALRQNYLTGKIPDEISQLLKLQILELGANNLTGTIPSSIFNISELLVIELPINSLSGRLPPTVGRWLPNLKVLTLWENKLDGPIPSSISNASMLTMLALSWNSFSGVVPAALGNLRLLQSLAFKANFLTTESSTSEINFLASLTNCKYLKNLWISENPLNGFLPTQIGNLSSSLEIIYADFCNIKGSIPMGIGNLSSLIVLNLSNNELTGPIPKTVGSLQKLQVLRLEGNELKGSIPPELCQLQSLGSLSLGGNELYGPLQPCLSNLTFLRYLNLSSNKLTSMIPLSLWNLTYILEVNLSSNFIGGYLPLEIKNLRVITKLDVSRNQLSGDIPYIIGRLRDLVFLSLADNKLQESIPESFDGLISLEFLDLSNNNLSGEIPMSLEKISNLKYFNVSCNRLRGPIPTQGPFVNFSAQSYMRNDALCGAPRLQVPPCRNGKQHPRAVMHLLNFILPIGAVAVLLLLVIIFALTRCQDRNRRSPVEANLLPLSMTWRKISYQELSQATNGFDQSNLLGRGGFGSVYKGTLSDGMNVAIKVFNLQQNEAWRSFDSECAVMCNFRHRNLAKIISSCSSNDFKALILDYMPNGSLEKWLYSYNYFLDIQQRLDIMIDVASALEYLHHHQPLPVIHCDLKPSNILLDEDMVAHVSDFGVAKLLEYGAQGIVSTKADVYSYGIMLMEVFTRMKPTDEIFSDEMSLTHWVSNSLLHSVSEVADSNLMGREDKDFAAKEQCVASIFSLALECTPNSPQQRINMEDAVTRLKKIKFRLLANIKMT
ncbi:hypothetical protein P3X46_026921 [Hevea brasiliensis]|uniref:Protein kinase domain-containing protein n=1 Tax=Hevea brasiliensis TaxID=3981 RepID=A0ABQ9L1E9_HEVBR|nr:hypothetical protein P3X46_026921 [Hevea brasiliensis]